MKVKATGGGGDFKILSAGTHAAVCTMIVGIGPQPVEFQGKTMEKDKLKLRFEVPDERIEWTDKEGVKGEGPMVIWGTYTASLHENAKLRAHLQAWRGRPFTDEELAGFDLDNILGKPCLITVTHREAGGKVFANIDTISGLVKGMQAPKAEGALVSFDFDSHTKAEFDALPSWLQDKVDAGTRLALEQQARAETAPPKPAGDPGFSEDDIPFS